MNLKMNIRFDKGFYIESHRVLLKTYKDAENYLHYEYGIKPPPPDYMIEEVDIIVDQNINRAWVIEIKSAPYEFTDYLPDKEKIRQSTLNKLTDEEKEVLGLI